MIFFSKFYIFTLMQFHIIIQVCIVFFLDIERSKSVHFSVLDQTLECAILFNQLNVLFEMSRLMGKPTMWFLNRSDQTGLYKHRKELEA